MALTNTFKDRASHAAEYVIDAAPRLIIFFSLFMIVSFMERFYNKGGGSFNSAITLAYVLIFVAIIVAHLKTIRFDCYDIVAMLCIAYFAMRFFDTRAFFYSAKAFIIYGVIKTQFRDLALLHRTIVVLGLACCLLFYRGSSRWTGFYNNSAPVFSLVMVCSVLYLLNKTNASKVDIALAGVASFLVVMTQTRVCILVVIALWIFKFGNRIISHIVAFLRVHKFIALCFLVAVVTFIAFNYLDLLNLVARDGDDGSDRTRIELMQGVVSQWVATPISFIFGNGGGYSMGYTALTHSSFSGHLPVHQDVLMLLCDYGIIGVLLFVVMLFPSARKWPWYCWLILVIATFHNVFTTSSASVLMFLTFQTLAYEREKNSSQSHKFMNVVCCKKGTLKRKPSSKARLTT